MHQVETVQAFLLLSILLLVAVKQGRVMLHVAGKRKPYKHLPNSTGRWCDRPPYTLDCSGSHPQSAPGSLAAHFHVGIVLSPLRR